MELPKSLQNLPGIKDIPGLDKLGNLGKINEVVAGVPVLVLRAVALHALILRGEDPAKALETITRNKSAIAEAAKD